MKVFRRNSTGSAGLDTEEGTELTTGESPAGTSQASRAATPKKGRPTPSRQQARGGRQGPAEPPPKTTREAIRRSRNLRKKYGKPKMTKEERREATRERRTRMMEGDERYLLPRDKGPVKAFVRDVIDSRRNLLGLFMPLALLVFASLLVPSPQMQQWATLFTMVMLFGMIVEGVANGRRITQMAREKFPNETIKGRSIGWYAFIRATQIRKLRVPKPRVNPGDTVRVQ